MALKYLTDIDLNNNELQNAVVQNVGTTPSSGLESGQIWFNSTDHYLYYYNGTTSIPLGAINFETNASNIKPDGVASVGSLSTVPRADHVHPAQIRYGECSEANNAPAKTVSITGFSLVTGANVFVKFKNGNIDTTATLNVNNTGAKPMIIYDGLGMQAYPTFSPNEIAEFVYDGTNWVVASEKDSNTAYSIGSADDLTNGTTGAKVWRGSTLHDYVSTSIGAANAMRFKGTVTQSSPLPTTGVKVGDTYMVNEAGTYAGQTCEVGDLIIATATTPTWTVAQTNINGAITSITGTPPISVTGSGASRTVAHENSGVTAASKGDTSNQTPTWGGTFKVTSGTVNATGHMTAFAEHTVKIPNATATTSAPGLMSASDKSTLQLLQTYATRSVIVTNPPLTSQNGICEWTVYLDMPLNLASVTIYDLDTNKQVMAEVIFDNNYQYTIKFISATNIADGKYSATITGVYQA